MNNDLKQVDLTCNYLGMNLKNPIIIGSSGLTGSLENIVTLAKKGAGAIVLKSIFEEQIIYESEFTLNNRSSSDSDTANIFQMIYQKRGYDYAEAMNYISRYAKEHTLSRYLKFSEEAVKSVDIPIIASINCISSSDWIYLTRRLQDTGVAAIELNIYILPSDLNKKSSEIEKTYQNIIQNVLKEVNIPVSLKIGYYFSGLSNCLYNISKSGISSLVLFNRPYSPDIDIENFEIISSGILSSANEYHHTLRWVALLSGKLGCDISATSGIHDSETMIKMLLAGAKTVQVASALYKNGFDAVHDILSGTETWMKRHGFSSVEEFRGKMSQEKIVNPTDYERVQFMKLYSRIE